MSRNRVFFLICLLGLASRARADSDSATTISAQGNALSNAKTAESLSNVMPSGPPALSQAGAPEGQTSVPRSAATPPDDAPVRAVAPRPAPEPPRLDPNRGARSAPENVVVGRRPAAAPQAVVPAPEAPRRGFWWLVLGVGAAAFVLGYLIH